MTQPSDVQWSNAEKEIAEAALKQAYNREIENLISDIREKAPLISAPEEVWQLHDFLSASRHDLDGKYDDRESFLMFTLSRLIKDGLLQKSDLEGLSADKQAKVKLLTLM